MINVRRYSWIASAFAALVVCPQLDASPIDFLAVYDGQSQIVGVVDPAGPTVQIESIAVGTGSLGLDEYFSVDIVDLSTGVGAGTNRFRAANGHELFGSFTLQLVPTAVPGVLDIFGLLTFNGGTGRFRHATGSADLTGRGAFIDADTANSHFGFAGTLFGVPEPGSAALMLLGVAGLFAGSRRELRRTISRKALTCSL